MESSACPYCDYTNIQKQDVTERLVAKHTTAKPHYCTFSVPDAGQCPGRFKLGKSLSIHKRVVHGWNSKTATTEEHSKHMQRQARRIQLARAVAVAVAAPSARVRAGADGSAEPRAAYDFMIKREEVEATSLSGLWLRTPEVSFTMVPAQHACVKRERSVVPDQRKLGQDRVPYGHYQGGREGAWLSRTFFVSTRPAGASTFCYPMS
ncbi:uncharacterized protein BXZ73DRAFT_80292 [Epithele typhae]|uniref:uncharacterized protein n=1 Tax=Epithele typhae TaxID=378194 RepID=UPI00200720B5|nr:uncharacterized protein BXZ73DRAFT_80292 [Epithele typhae]KAH9919773.1 hypothetical protein BXZ73DRAFT_80292 [Epithele typhae]